jgi:Fe-S oxidoreductase
MEEDELAAQVRMCAACPKMCRHVCPTFFAWRSDSPTPHGRALLIHQEITGTRALDERAIEVLYQCLECSHCLTWCKPEIDIAEIVEIVRRRLVEEGRQPDGIKRLESKITENHNPFGENPEQRIAKFQIMKTNGTPIFYFTGCTTAYREQNIANETISLLSSMGYSVQVSSDEWCCGSPLFRTGYEEKALTQAHHNLKLLNESDAEFILVTCPGCFRALTYDYPRYGLELNKPVKHITQLLEEYLETLPNDALDKKITYHDPCHLGRHSGIYDAPRKVLERLAGSSFVEMERNRDNAMCCGNGAGLRTLFKEQAKLIGTERIRHAKLVGAEYLVTACPFCKNMLISQADESITIMDLPELVNLVMSEKDQTTT